MSGVYPSLRMLIDGEWVTAGGRDTRPIVDPATGARLGDLPLADEADLDRALAASERAFGVWRNTPAGARARVLRDAAAIVRRRGEDIARIGTREEGKPIGETLAEVGMTAALFEFYAGECLRNYGRVLTRPAGQLSRVVHEPVGPVAAFAPWNFPVYNPARKLGAPVAAGCPVILKPAEEAPGSAIAIVEALIEAGLPSGVVQLVFGVPDQVSRRLLASPIIRKLSFTGSTAVGKHLLRLAADTVKRCTMELGGHAPVIVFDDADLDRAVEMLGAAKIRNAGQVCVSPTRFFVQEAVHDRFVAAFTERLEATRVGNGFDRTTQMGPTANPRRPEALTALIDDARTRGGEVRTGGERMDGDGFFFHPTLIANVPDDARIMREEPFGPVALTQPFATLDEVVGRANALPYGLAAYAFTENARRANLIASALEAGMVGINMTAMAAADSPFGGVKESGYGSEDGQEGYAACLVTKAIHQA